MPLRTAAPKKKIKHKKQNELDQEQRKMAKSNSGAIKTEKKKAAKAEEWKCPMQSPVSPHWERACVWPQVLIHLNSVLEIRLIFEFLLRFVLILNIHATNLHWKQHKRNFPYFPIFFYYL